MSIRQLTLTLPERVTVNTGLDVFFHAFEAYVSKDENEYADMFAKRAIELVVENLKKCVDNPQDIEARSAMSLANMLAGTAISLSGTFKRDATVWDTALAGTSARRAGKRCVRWDRRLLGVSLSGEYPQIRQGGRTAGGGSTAGRRRACT